MDRHPTKWSESPQVVQALELRVSTPAHVKQPGWYVEFESRVRTQAFSRTRRDRSPCSKCGPSSNNKVARITSGCAGIFPDPYFAVGGDEVSYECAAGVSKTKRFLQQHNMTAAGLLPYFWRRSVGCSVSRSDAALDAAMGAPRGDDSSGFCPAQRGHRFRRLLAAVHLAQASRQKRQLRLDLPPRR